MSLPSGFIVLENGLNNKHKIRGKQSIKLFFTYF